MKNRFRFLVLGMIMVALVLSASQLGTKTVEASMGTALTVHMVEVGGAGYIVKLPNGKVMVVDAGVGADETIFINKLNSLSVTKVDYLIGTHKHSDHIANFDAIIDEFNIGKIIFPAAPADGIGSSSYDNMKAKADIKGIVITKVDKGDNLFPDITFDDGKKLKSFVYAPDPNINYEATYPPATMPKGLANAYSLVFSIKYGLPTRTDGILFTGDAMNVTLADITSSTYTGDTAFAMADIQVLVAAHHGGNTTNSDTFLQYLKDESLERVIIGNLNDAKADFKARLQAKNLWYWSNYAQNDVWLKTQGEPSRWYASEPAEWKP
jgi:competence protein ComEC